MRHFGNISISTFRDHVKSPITSISGSVHAALLGEKSFLLESVGDWASLLYFTGLLPELREVGGHIYWEGYPSACPKLKYVHGREYWWNKTIEL